MVNINEFLSYNELDDKQKNMIIEMINIIQPHTMRTRTLDNNLRPIGDWKPVSELKPVRSKEEVESWEEKHNVKLPEDFKWFITTVGTEFYPDYKMYDINDNAYYTTEIDSTIDEELECIEIKGDYFFNLGCAGCTFCWTIQLREYHYGYVRQICWDTLWDFNDPQTKEEVEKILDDFASDPSYKSFLEFYKDSLVVAYKEKVLNEENVKAHCWG